MALGVRCVACGAVAGVTERALTAGTIHEMELANAG